MTKDDFTTQMRALAQRLIDFALTRGKNFGITDVRISIAELAKVEKSLEQGVVASALSGTTLNVQVTLLAGDRVLSFIKNTADVAELENAMLDNMHVIHLSPENATLRLLEAARVFKGPFVELDLCDTTPASDEDLTAYARTVETAALSVPGVIATRSVSIKSSQRHSLTLSTNGVDQASSSTSYTVSAEVVAAAGDAKEIDGEYAMTRYAADLPDAATLGIQAGQNAVSKLNATSPATGETTIVLGHDAAAQFYSAVLQALDGTALYRGTTMFKDKLGQQIMNAGITIVDDPHVTRGLASTQADATGLECAPVTLIENGVLKAYLISLHESRQLNITPTGREYGATNVSILPGIQSPEQLIRDIDKGILIKGFNGGTVNTNNGTHSREAYGVIIRNGKITDEAVSGFVVSGTLTDMFMRASIANDTPAHPNSKYTLAAPTTRIDGMMISGK